MSEARDILMRMKRLFTSGRWTQHTMRKGAVIDDQELDVFCLVGGLREACGVYGGGRADGGENMLRNYDEAGLALARALSHHPNPRSFERALIMYNDRQDTTVEKVVELIDDAIRRVEATDPPGLSA